MVLGGISEFMKVTALAQAHDLVIAPHGAQEVHIHLVGAIANGLILGSSTRATWIPMWGKIYTETLTLNDDGTVSPPEVPGIGLEPRYDTLQQYREA